MPLDMLTLIRHVVGATNLVVHFRRALRRRHGRDAVHRQSSNNALSDDHDQGSDHRSPRAGDEQPTALTNNHDHEQVGPPTSSHHEKPTTSSSHNHEQARPSTLSHHEQAVDPDQHEAPPDQQAHDGQNLSELVKVAPFTEQASTSTTIDVSPTDV